MKKTYKIKIEPLTALHVGTGEKITPLDYKMVKVKSSDGKIKRKYARFSTDSILRRIATDENLSSEFDKFSEKSDMKSLQSFFHSQVENEDILYLCEVTKDFEEKYNENIKKDPLQNAAEVLEMYRPEGAKFPTIPGSSIKGAIRTAILNQVLLKEMSDSEYDELVSMADEKKQKDLKKSGSYEKQIQEQALSMLKVSGIDSAKLDPFRCVEISDCEFSAKNQIVGKMRNAKIDKFKKELVFNDMQIIAEAICGKLTKKENYSEFELRINEDLQNAELNNGFCINMQIDLEKIISACNFFFKKEFNEEYQKFYKDAYDGVDEIFELKKIIDSIPENSTNQFLIRVGRWSQIESVTFEENFRNPKTPTKKGKVMPSGTSRTVFNYDGQYLPMGWCRCTVQN